MNPTRKLAKLRKMGEHARKVQFMGVQGEEFAPTRDVDPTNQEENEDDWEEMKGDDENGGEDEENLEFEDPFDDEYDQEEVANLEEVNNQLEQGQNGEEEEGGEWVEVGPRILEPTRQDAQIDEEMKGDSKKKKKKKNNEQTEIFMGSVRDVAKGEFLDFDNRCYEMLHRAQADWPCLTCDFVVPQQNFNSPAKLTPQALTTYPVDVFVVAGTQASDAKKNELYLMKWSELCKTKYDDDEYHEGSDNGADDEPTILYRSFALKAGVNRVRTMMNTPIVAAWLDSGEFIIVDLKSHYEYLANVTDEKYKREKGMKLDKNLLGQFPHQMEGFAIDWSSMQVGTLASGCQDETISLYTPGDENGSTWEMSSKRITAHRASVEDLQFSPVEAYALASCSVDGTVKIYDLRDSKAFNHGSISIDAHESDVNVISWEDKNGRLIASGADDGSFRIWDTRKTDRPISDIVWHSGPITSIQFQPGEDAFLAVASADNKLSLWDFATEPDHEDDEAKVDIPDQLLFLHQGQDDLKELRFHPLYHDVLVSTAANGFHIFKPNLEGDIEASDSEDEEDEMMPRGREERKIDIE